MTTNKSVLAWIDEMKELVQPDKLVWIDGSEEQLEALRAEACSTGEMHKLNQEKLPGCYLHRTAVNDVARVEDRTMICSKKEEDAGPTNHWMDPEKAYKMLYDIARGSYKGRTMYVIPYSMGPVGSPLAKIGVELTDSIYVVLNMAIMTRVGQKVWDTLGDSTDWVKGLHCKCDIDAEKRYIMHFPEDNTIISVNSGYGGNVLLGKKVLRSPYRLLPGQKRGLDGRAYADPGHRESQGREEVCGRRLPVRLRQDQPWPLADSDRRAIRRRATRFGPLAMISLGCARAPTAACGPSTRRTASSALPPGTNMKSNPNALISTQKGTIFTNVVQNLDDNTVWWEGLDKNPPEHALNWKGEPGTARPLRKRAPIPTAVSPLPRRTAPVSAMSSIPPAASDFRHHLWRPPRSDHSSGISVP